jgi:hypothetical protein
LARWVELAHYFAGCLDENLCAEPVACQVL